MCTIIGKTMWRRGRAPIGRACRAFACPTTGALCFGSRTASLSRARDVFCCPANGRRTTAVGRSYAVSQPTWTCREILKSPFPPSRQRPRSRGHPCERSAGSWWSGCDREGVRRQAAEFPASRRDWRTYGVGHGGEHRPDQPPARMEYQRGRSSLIGRALSFGDGNKYSRPPFSFRSRMDWASAFKNTVLGPVLLSRSRSWLPTTSSRRRRDDLVLATAGKEQ